MRIWPGVVIAVAMVLVRVIAPLFPDGTLVAVLGPLAGGALILLWWLFFSRARWTERLGLVAVLIAAGYASMFIVHPSIRGGLMGRMVPFFFAIPGLALALVVWAAATRRVGSPSRYAAFVAIVAATCGLFALVRTDGLLGGVPQLAWRWTPTAEDRLLAQAASEPLPVAAAAVPEAPAAAPERPSVKPAEVPAAPAGAKPVDPAPGPAGMKTPTTPAIGERGVMRVEWPGFRGTGRDSVVRGVRLETDWAKTPPVAIWRRPIGPGWSSFAVAGDCLYTQEQRGDHEIVACYSATTGKPVWAHKDAARFYESNGGAGPRGTPTISDGRVHALGATGILNALDAATGAVVWKRDAVADAGVKLPGWGITSSPLVIGDLVVVAASGAIVAYDRTTGDRRWVVKSTGGSYSSPQLFSAGGVQQILLNAGSGLTAVGPADGAVLWKFEWAGTPIVQPGVIADGDLLLTTSDAMGGLGVRRLAVSRGTDGWKVEERWMSNTLKPYYNDYVIHNGHAYGYDGNILACVDLADGKRKWKGGRYGNGQVVLLADQDLLLVISEEGELALVKATPDNFTEVAARIPGIEGKTWNHPVIVGEMLFVRNGQEMAAFRLPVAPRPLTTAR
jgi:outer membrane protein assembly factor BamB